MTTKNQRIFITCFRKKSILFCFTLTICRKRYMGGRVKKRVKKRQKEIMNIAKETLSIGLGYVILLLMSKDIIFTVDTSMRPHQGATTSHLPSMPTLITPSHTRILPPARERQINPTILKRYLGEGRENYLIKTCTDPPPPPKERKSIVSEGIRG